MGSIGIEKLLLIGIALLIFFGPKKLPELGKALGQGIREFKKASKEFQESVAEGAAAPEGEKKV
jgi:sec-independent protein translocase protein TatA